MSPAGRKNANLLRRCLVYGIRRYRSLSERIISITGLPPSEVRTYVVQAAIAVIVTALLTVTYLGVTGIFSAVAGLLPFIGDEQSVISDNRGASQDDDTGL